MINNRQNGRRRGRGGGNNGGGNAPRQGGQGRDNGNRIDNRARGNAAQLLEKYKGLAADAQRQGDRVNTEYYLQFADHYFRVLSEQRSRFEDQQPQQQRRQQADSFDDDGDDYGDEGEPMRGDEMPQGREDSRQDARRDSREESRRDEGRRDDGRRDEGQRETGQRDMAQREESRGDDRPRRDDQPRRREGQRGDGQRSEAPRREPRAAQANGQGQAPAPSYERTDDRAPRVEAAQPPLPVNDVAPVAEDAPVAPRRRGRPPKVRDEVADAAPPATFDADRLPPSLSIPASVAPESNDDGEAEVKPRRRRGRPPAAEVQAG